jgi:uncharacterized protein (DUF2062 family)
MTAVILGLLVAGAATLTAFTVVWARWHVRDRRRRRRRLDERAERRDELDRAMRRLRMRIE